MKFHNARKPPIPGPRHRPPAGPPATLSVCMIARNEAGEIGDCLRSVKPAADEIIVVDTGSEDATKAVAAACGAKVFDFPWCDDFSAARNESLRHATGDYILWLDADDRIEAEEATKLRELKRRLPKTKDQAFLLVVRDENPVNGKIYFHQLRLFPNIPAARFQYRVHEEVFASLRAAGVSQKTAGVIICHTGYSDLATIEKKSERNLAILEKDLAIEPENPIFLFHAGRTLANLDRRPEAIERMKKVAENTAVQQTHPELALEAGILAGRYAFEMRDYAEAESSFRDMVQRHPRSGLLHFHLGSTLLMQDHYPEAAEELRQSLRFPLELGLFPVNFDLVRYQQHYYLGIAYQRMGNNAEARTILQKSLEVASSENYLSLQLLGLMSLQELDYARAVNYYEQALPLALDPNQIYANLGVAYHRIGRTDQAEKMFRSALGCNPDRLEALINLGYLCLEKKDYDQALHSFTRAKRLDPAAVDVKLALSRIYGQRGDLDRLVKECSALLSDLGMPQVNTLEGIEDVAALYADIGDALLRQQRRQLALWAYQIGFLTYPLPEILSKLLALAQATGSLPACLADIPDVLARHAQNPAAIAAVRQELDRMTV